MQNTIPTTSIALPNHFATVPALTPQDAATLTRVFDVEDYEFKPTLSPAKAKERNYQIWLTYVGEEAIIERLNEVDPSWTFTLDRVEQRGNSYSIYSTLTLKGFVRQGIGIGDDEKAAATDSLKRAARLFGVGAHLKRSPNLYTDPGMKRQDAENIVRGKFAAWLGQSSSTPPQQSPAAPAPAPASGSEKPASGVNDSGNRQQNEDPVDTQAFWQLVNSNNLGDAVRTRMIECHGTMDVTSITRTQAFDIFNFCTAEAQRTTEDDSNAQANEDATSGK